jgi:hypothetical protein
MQQVDPTASLFAPFFLLLGGLDSEQVLNMQEVTDLSAKVHKRLVFDARRLADFRSWELVDWHTAILFGRDREFIEVKAIFRNAVRWWASCDRRLHCSRLMLM